MKGKQNHRASRALLTCLWMQTICTFLETQCPTAEKSYGCTQIHRQKCTWTGLCENTHALPYEGYFTNTTVRDGRATEAVWQEGQDCNPELLLSCSCWKIFGHLGHNECPTRRDRAPVARHNLPEFATSWPLKSLTLHKPKTTSLCCIQYLKCWSLWIGLYTKQVSDS